MPAVIVLPPPIPSTDSGVEGPQNIVVLQTGNTGGFQRINTNEIVSIGQFQLALAAVNFNDTVFQSLSANMNDQAWVQYKRCATIRLGDSLSNFVQSLIGYSDAQMAALFVTASALSL